MSWTGDWKTVHSKWHFRFLELAAQVAGWSKDLDHRVGALLVAPGMQQMSPGYNGLPRGVNDEAYLPACSKDLKLQLTVHSEVNALDNAAFPVAGSALYVTRHPCLKCAVSILNRGVAMLVCPPPEPDSSWYDEQRAARNLLIDLVALRSV